MKLKCFCDAFNTVVPIVAAQDWCPGCLASRGAFFPPYSRPFFHELLYICRSHFPFVWHGSYNKSFLNVSWLPKWTPELEWYDYSFHTHEGRHLCEPEGLAIGHRNDLFEFRSLPWMLEQPFLVAQRTKIHANQGAAFWLQPIWTLIKWKQFPHNPYFSMYFLSWLLSHFCMKPIQLEWFSST